MGHNLGLKVRLNMWKMGMKFKIELGMKSRIGTKMETKLRIVMIPRTDIDYRLVKAFIYLGLKIGSDLI